MVGSVTATATPSRPDTGLERELGQLLRGHLLELLRTAHQPGPSALGVEILRLLAAEAPLRACDVAEEFAVTRTSVSRHVTDLTRAGLVEQSADPSDGRAVLLQLTLLGHEALDAHDERRRALYGELTQGWTEPEKATFVDLLQRLNAAGRLIVTARVGQHSSPRQNRSARPEEEQP